MLKLPTTPWWYYLLSVLVFAGFYVMFTGIVRKYAQRIEGLPEPKTAIFKTFSVKGYIIIAFMISPRLLHCLVLLRPWPRPPVSRHPLHPPLAEIQSFPTPLPATNTLVSITAYIILLFFFLTPVGGNQLFNFFVGPLVRLFG